MGRKGGPPDYGGRGIQGIVVQHNKYNQALEEDFPGIEHAPEENEEGKQSGGGGGGGEGEAEERGGG